MLLTERHGDVALVRLNRPEKLNALNESLMSALSMGLDVISKDGRVTGMVITGAGRAFCAGGDLEMLAGWQELAVDERKFRFLAGAALATRLAPMPIPVVAAVNGPAVGAGFNLQTCALISAWQVDRPSSCRDSSESVWCRTSAD